MGKIYMDNAQLMKGILEGCILSVISMKETYGYEIIQILSEAGFTDLQEGTLYPILTRLEKKGYISCRKEKSALGPIRKYFKITEAGSIGLDEFLKSYKEVAIVADKIFYELPKKIDKREEK